ncbi:Protein FAM166B [Collichthys lucidus]|uniref:Ciliary microtubule inner protein 2B n=1 Tax=Collichthys lucidus TaxID=240159 RepID=A0A4U5V9X7_COLLU|nr:Protein FAM166B [Collichthys lucidus]
MDEYAPKFSKVLVTPDPHYTPGYTGYCPQLKYHFGKTYAQQTAKLLTNPEVRHSKHLLLSRGRVPSKSAVTLIPDSELRKTIPGYTGLIPNRQDYFGCSYAEICRKALSESHHRERSRIQQQSAELPIIANDTNRQFKRTKLPLAPISNKPFCYKPLNPFTPPGRPHNMDDDDPQKCFISGFAGHVPKTRFLIGKGYPMMTNQALIQFGKQQRSDPTSLPGRKDSTIPPMPRIYQSKAGVVPAFTGHIPGYKFMYGQTFGKLTRIALDKWQQQQEQSSKVIEPSNTSVK